MSKRTITGVVSSIAGDKTIVVTRTVRETHPLYGKKFTITPTTRTTKPRLATRWSSLRASHTPRLLFGN